MRATQIAAVLLLVAATHAALGAQPSPSYVFRDDSLLPTASGRDRQGRSMPVHEMSGESSAPAALGLAFVRSLPRQASHSPIDDGIGFNVHLIIPIDRRGAADLRADYDFVRYGSEGLFDNQFRVFSIGGQLAVPRGPIRPYVRGAVGLAYFQTTEEITNERQRVRHCDGDDDGNVGFWEGMGCDSTVMGDVTKSFLRSAGVYVPLARDRDGGEMLLDVSVGFVDNGEARYRRPGSTTNLYGRTRVRVVHVGVTFSNAFGGGRRH